MRTNSLAACSYKSLVEVVCLYCYQEGAMLSWVEEKTMLGLKWTHWPYKNDVA